MTVGGSGAVDSASPPLLVPALRMGGTGVLTVARLLVRMAGAGAVTVVVDVVMINGTGAVSMGGERAVLLAVGCTAPATKGGVGAGEVRMDGPEAGASTRGIPVSVARGCVALVTKGGAGAGQVRMDAPGAGASTRGVPVSIPVV